MPIQTLIILTFAVFLVLWIADLFFTLRVTKLLGENVEVNPLLRFFIGIRGRFLHLFKVVEILLFSYLLWQVSLLDEEMAFSILLGIILVYSFVVLVGMKIYIDAALNSIPIVMLFLSVTVLLLVFIYLTHIEYQNKVSVYNALSVCSSRYTELYHECSITGFSNKSNLSDYPEFDFDLTIDRWEP